MLLARWMKSSLASGRIIPWLLSLYLILACFDIFRLSLAFDGSEKIIGSQDETPGVRAVSRSLFSSLERASRLVDITYCIGNSGISRPFSCVSRCKDFPRVHLVTTWHTGMLMTDSCGYIAVDHGDGEDGPAILVAFRGTYSLANTIVDLSTVPQEYVPYPPADEADGEKCDNCTVHMGFLTSWRNARETVLPTLKSVRELYPTYPVHVMGHSLGGAVAALAGLDVKKALKWQDLRVTTFGEPRVGNRALVSYIDKAFGMDKDDGYDSDLEKRVYQRVTHADDPVPLLPPTQLGYRSHAGEIHISKQSLPPEPKDVRMCRGDQDGRCAVGAESVDENLLRQLQAVQAESKEAWHAENWTESAGFPGGLKLWQILFAHRDYFWRLGLCVPGGDPIDWGRDHYNVSATS